MVVGAVVVGAGVVGVIGVGVIDVGVIVVGVVATGAEGTVEEVVGSSKPRDIRFGVFSRDPDLMHGDSRHFEHWTLVFNFPTSSGAIERASEASSANERTSERMNEWPYLKRL